MKNNSDYEMQKARYISMLEDNVNISKTSDGKEFCWLIASVLSIILVLYVVSGLAANFVVDKMTYKTQFKLESLYRAQNRFTNDLKYQYELKKLEKIKKEIVVHDKVLQAKNDFPLYVLESKDVNAMVTPDGTILVTSGLLKELKNDEALAFVMAHELGHYRHRDHLKSIGRQLIWQVLTLPLTAGSSSSGIGQLTYSAGGLTELSYSKEQELSADSFANNYVKKRYGSNRSAVEFFNYLEKNYNVPEFVHYFSTHPSPQQRIENLSKLK